MPKTFEGFIAEVRRQRLEKEAKEAGTTYMVELSRPVENPTCPGERESRVERVTLPADGVGSHKRQLAALIPQAYGSQWELVDFWTPSQDAANEF